MTRKFFIQKTKGGIQSYTIKAKKLKEKYQRIARKGNRNVYIRLYFRHLAAITLSFRRPKEKNKESPTGLHVKAWRTDNKKMSKKQYEKLEKITKEKIKKYEHYYLDKKGNETFSKYIQLKIANGVDEKGETKYFYRRRRSSSYDYVIGSEFNVKISGQENDAFHKNKWQVALTGGMDNQIIEEGGEK